MRTRSGCRNFVVQTCNSSLASENFALTRLRLIAQSALLRRAVLDTVTTRL